MRERNQEETTPPKCHTPKPKVCPTHTKHTVASVIRAGFRRIGETGGRLGHHLLEGAKMQISSVADFLRSFSKV